MRFFHQYHNATQIIHNRQIVFPPHLHREIEIIVLYTGCFTLTVNGKDYRMEAGDFLLIDPYAIHSYATEEDVDVGKFIFSPEQVPGLGRMFDEGQITHPIIPRRQAEETGLLPLSREILERYEHASPLVQKGYLLLLTGKLLELCQLEKHTAQQDLPQRVFAFCRENFQRRLTQNEVARALGISESHLSHLFCCKLKINFCQYINNLRINEACRLLAESDKSVIDIGEESGFSSLRSFNRVFQQHCGMTPTAYRKLI